MTKYKIIISISLASLLLSILFLSGLFTDILQNKEFYFSNELYKKRQIKIDSIVYTGTRYTSFHGEKTDYPNFRIYSLRPNNKSLSKNLDSLFEVKQKVIWVFFKDYESPAYFVEDEFQEMSFKSIWLPVLRNLGIFILIVLNFFFWRHKYHQAILATGMSLDEYSRLQESKRPKRKSLSEEYEEIMKKENEKKNQP